MLATDRFSLIAQWNGLYIDKEIEINQQIRNSFLLYRHLTDPVLIRYRNYLRSNELRLMKYSKVRS